MNEFRQDLVSGDWVLISPERSQRPGWYKKPEIDPDYIDINKCPFEKIVGAGNEVVHAVAGDEILNLRDPELDKKWTTIVIKNKFPIMTAGVSQPSSKNGIFTTVPAVGAHEVVITRDHERSFAQFNIRETAEVLKVYRQRYLGIVDYRCGSYILIFHNHGRSAGASVYHNHSQIISTPIIPPEVAESLHGSARYWRENGKRVHDTMIEFELTEKKRVVYENSMFIVFCPFVSKSPYEMRIFPKATGPHFETISDSCINELADAVNVVACKLNSALENISYNMYIHTAPVRDDEFNSHEAYCWHIEVVPRITTFAGFELGTAIYVNPVDPDMAAKTLREAKI